MTEEQKARRREKERERGKLRKAYWTARRIEKKEELKKYDAERHATPHGRAILLAATYRKDDKKRGFDTSENIDAAWVEGNVFNGQRCVYCGESDWMKLGVDRLDNGKPHAPENCVCACLDCNNKKGNRHSPIEFQAIKTSEKFGY